MKAISDVWSERATKKLKHDRLARINLCGSWVEGREESRVCSWPGQDYHIWKHVTRPNPERTRGSISARFLYSCIDQENVRCCACAGAGYERLWGGAVSGGVGSVGV